MDYGGGEGKVLTFRLKRGFYTLGKCQISFRTLRLGTLYGIDSCMFGNYILIELIGKGMNVLKRNNYLRNC